MKSRNVICCVSSCSQCYLAAKEQALCEWQSTVLWNSDSGAVTAIGVVVPWL